VQLFWFSDVEPPVGANWQVNASGLKKNRDADYYPEQRED
jgi:hypothetical protein